MAMGHLTLPLRRAEDPGRSLSWLSGKFACGSLRCAPAVVSASQPSRSLSAVLEAELISTSDLIRNTAGTCEPKKDADGPRMERIQLITTDLGWTQCSLSG